MATKKDLETIAEGIETAVEDAGKEVKKAVKKAAPKAAEAAETVEKAVKKTAAKAEKAAAEAVSEAAARKKRLQGSRRRQGSRAKGRKESGAAAKARRQKAKGGGRHEKALKVCPRLKQRILMRSRRAQDQVCYKNVMQNPRLEKVIINMGLGSDKDNPKGIEAAVKELSTIAGQKAVITRAKKSVANFKVREGMSIGAKVTLRGDRMYYFVDKLMNIVLPRVRDFRGVSDKAFDGRGNYALGLKEQLIFPEINYDKVDKVRGMNIVFGTSARTEEECKELLTQLGMPFVQG